VFPHDHRYLRRAFVKAVTEAQLTPFRFHDLRHTFASRLAMNGANDRTLMALGGWKSTRMLDRYAHLSPAHLWQAVEGLTHRRDSKPIGEAVQAEIEGLMSQPQVHL
jgi:integrase